MDRDPWLDGRAHALAMVACFTVAVVLFVGSAVVLSESDYPRWVQYTIGIAVVLYVFRVVEAGVAHARQWWRWWWDEFSRGFRGEGE